MKQLSPQFQAHLDSGATTLAWCWKITRTDGTVFGFTDHDRTLSFGGVSYEPETGLDASAMAQGSDMSVDAMDAVGALASDRITETDIAAGLWDGAEVEIWRVNWADTSQTVLMRRGALGQIRRGKTAFTAEMRSAAHVLNQPVGRTFQYYCDAKLGDARCGVDLEDPAYKATGTVAAAVGDRGFATADLDAFADGHFSLGHVVWDSGANAGRLMEVRAHGAGSITLRMVPVRAIAAGDTFTIRAGCDKQRPTCKDKFANVDNFRGFPDIPGDDSIIRYARKGGSNDGGVL